MNNYILAIDPSLTQTGIALLDKKGKIIFKGIFKTKPKDKDERYFQIMEYIISLVIKYEPRVLAIETQFYSFNVGGALKLSKLRGMIIGSYKTVIQEGKVIEISPMTAKSAFGVKNKHFEKGKSKEAVRKAVLKMYPKLKDAEEDIIDAVSIGWAGYLNIKKEK